MTLSSGLNGINESESSVQELFQMSGVKKSLLENAEYSDSKISIKDASKILAKSFINGKCDHFENSSIYIVKGHEGVGKTLFVHKLKNLFETQNDGKSCTVFEQVNPKKS